MQTAPTNWATYFASLNHKKEYRVTISESDGTSPVTYGVDSIKAASIESALLATDRWIGNCISSKLTISLLKPVTVPRMARIKVEVRLVLGSGYTDYVTAGYWWVDERESSTNWITLTCYDAMLKTEQTFIDEEIEDGEWPITMSAAVTEICTRTGLTLDSRTTILTGTNYIVPYTNDLTMREVLENIAAAHGGNWTITPQGKLRLVLLASAGSTPVIALGQNVKSFYSADAITISKVTLYDDAENAFSAGDTTEYTLSADCLYATSAIANALCNTTDGTLYGVVYTPFEAIKTYLNPLFELGDDLSVNGISSVIYKADISLTTAYTVDISCPYEQEVDHEYPYLSQIKRTNNRAVKLNTSYYGTTISRANGVAVEKLVSDVLTAKAVFNADEISMKVLKDSSWVNQLYVGTDPDTGDPVFYFGGKLTADVITALSALITPNLYAEKATISELTVDQLDTSTKVQNYLNSSTADVNYIKVYGQYIQFITASTTGSADEQAVNRYNEPLYWTDDTHTAATTDETDYPVMVYVYTEAIKTQIAFELEGSAYEPVIVLGQGTSLTETTWGKAYIWKSTTGLMIKYITESGAETAINLTDYVDAKMRRVDTVEIDKTAGEISVLMEGETTPVTLSYTEDATSMTITWPDSHAATFTIS